MKSLTTTIALMTLAALAMPVGTASAGVSSFGIHVGNGHFGLSLGFSDYWVHRGHWSNQSASLSFDTTLHGYGEWIWVDGLGRVWRPSVRADWRPYSHGRWTYTDVGWTWLAYEPWGYVPHHYGEWAFTTHGWAWVPGYTYRPAHVAWVSCGSYVGWYARGPRGWSHSHRGYHRGYNHGYSDGYGDGWHDARHATYVPWKAMGSENVSRHAVDSRHVQRASASGRSATRDAPSRSEVRRRGGGMVQQVELDRKTMRMGDRNVTVARPRGVAPSIEKNASDTVRRALTPAASAKLTRAHEAPRRSARTAASKSARTRPTQRDAGDRARGQRTVDRQQSRESGQRGRSASVAQPARQRRTSDTTSRRAEASPNGSRNPSRETARQPARRSTTGRSARQPETRSATAAAGRSTNARNVEARKDEARKATRNDKRKDRRTRSNGSRSR